MELATTRFILIDGTSVTANVKSASEAKLASKEVRQKKREYLHIRKGLTRDLKAAQKIAGKAGAKKITKQPGLLSRVGSAIAGLAMAHGQASARMDMVSLEEECTRTDEVLHNLDAVLIQLQGKLLHHS